MHYNLESLVPLQKKLDETIRNNHHVTNEDTINERILAFIVELGEFANETRCFKYWSLKKASEASVILEEYVDGIHFLLSLGIDYNINFNFDIICDNDNLTLLILDVSAKAAQLVNNINKDNLENVFKTYLKIAAANNIDEQAIINAYLRKNEVNFERQENNY
ncbi:MAG: dUTP diphosphatase [Bacilli bacterium]|jgi:dimeric dUTPase (all-alpha-NTP-PPase superfamily)|nr:dUTP diphosphatase [Bacilli bacterium]